MNHNYGGKIAKDLFALSLAPERRRAGKIMPSERLLLFKPLVSFRVSSHEPHF